MPEGRLVIRADANPTIGTGHVMRMIALAQAWGDAGGEACFVGLLEPEAMCQRVLDEGFELKLASAAHPDPADAALLLECTAPGDWIALDGYHFDVGYMRALRSAGRRLLVVDDNCDRGEYDADIYLNQSLGADTLRPALNASALRLLGPRHALLRREFLAVRECQRACPAQATHLLITYGGADPANATGQALEALASLARQDIHAKVVVGAANPHADRLAAQAAAMACRCEVLRAADNMPELMSWADLALSASGSTCWELCLCGVPMLLSPIADNQEGIARELEKAGAAHVSPPEACALSEALGGLLHDASARSRMSVSSRGLVDGAGARRVVQAMLGLGLRLRPATVDDAALLLSWRNAPEARAQSFNPSEIDLNTHSTWLAARFASPNCLLFIAEDFDCAPVGQLRFDCSGNRAHISIQVGPGRQGKGFGTAMLRKGCAILADVRPGSIPEAHVKPDNTRSAAMFLAAGFRPVAPDASFGQPHLRFELLEGDDVR